MSKRTAPASVEGKAPEPPVMITFSVELSNGHFKGQIRAPLHQAPEAQKETIDNWLKMIETGLKMGANSMDATFTPKTKAPIARVRR